MVERLQEWHIIEDGKNEFQVILQICGWYHSYGGKVDDFLSFVIKRWWWDWHLYEDIYKT